MFCDLSGKRAIVCGSTRGIGRACAEKLAELGASVVLLARDEALLAKVAAGLGTSVGQKHAHLCADFTDPPAVQRIVAQHIAQTSPAHILVNNTGGPPPGPILDATPHDFAKALTAHLHCNHLLVQTLAPGMKQLGYGRVVNIISLSVKAPIPGLGVSNTTRGAVASWAKTLAGELGPFGITVNNVLPGYTATDRLTALLTGNAAKQGISLAELEKRLQADIPARRFGLPEEIAAAVAFLASPVAAYINGINLPVDGGRLPTL